MMPRWWDQPGVKWLLLQTISNQVITMDWYRLHSAPLLLLSKKVTLLVLKAKAQPTTNSKNI